jgi:SpoVK/Ycf46/Vps4 family AAA+-type ATPase
MVRRAARVGLDVWCFQQFLTVFSYCSSELSRVARAPVVVLGATNRPHDLDPAFLRRMPVQVRTVMPDVAAREAILRAQLRSEKVDPALDLGALAVAVGEVSGSDIREVVRVAKQHRAKKLLGSLKETLATAADSEVDDTKSDKAQPVAPADLVVRPLTLENFQYALHKRKTASEHSRFHVGLTPQSHVAVCFLLLCAASETNAFGSRQTQEEAANRYVLHNLCPFQFC